MIGDFIMMKEREALLLFNREDNDSLNRKDLDWDGFGEVPSPDNLSKSKFCPNILNRYRLPLEVGFKNELSSSFSGKILNFGKNKEYVVLDNVLFFVEYYFYSVPQFCDEHVWVKGDIDSIPDDIKRGDTIEFTGIIYLYRKRNGDLNYSIKDFHFIEKVEKPIVPKYFILLDITREACLSRIVCSACIYNKDCFLSKNKQGSYLHQQFKSSEYKFFCQNSLWRDFTLSQMVVMDIFSCIYVGYELTYHDIARILVNPDKLENLRAFLKGWRYGCLSGKERLKLFDSFFFDSYDKWKEYMDENKYTEQTIFLFDMYA